MSALSSLIIVLDVLRDKKRRDWFSFERIWKKNTDRTDAGYARSDQSLPPDGGLLPQPLCGRFSLR